MAKKKADKVVKEPKLAHISDKEEREFRDEGQVEKEKEE